MGYDACHESRVGRWGNADDISIDGAFLYYNHPDPQTEKTTAEKEKVFLSAIAQGRDLPVQPTIQDIERFAPEWAALVPADDRQRAALAKKFADKYRFRRQDVPALSKVLGLETDGVKQAYDRLFRKSVDSIYATSIPLAEKIHWLTSRLANNLERMPPFWTAFSLTLTETVGGSVLALPIALAGVGPIPGVVLLFVLGLVNIVTIMGYRAGEWDAWFGRRPPLGEEDNSPAGALRAGKLTIAPLNCRDEDMPDFKFVDYAIAQLNKKHDKPFFIACGLKKPHLPWSVPKKYYEKFPVESIQLPPYKEDDLDDLPPIALQMATRSGDHEAILKQGGTNTWKQAIRAYLAAINFCDTMVGRLLDAYDQSPARDNTIKPCTPRQFSSANQSYAGIDERQPGRS